MYHMAAHDMNATLVAEHNASLFAEGCHFTSEMQNSFIIYADVLCLDHTSTKFVLDVIASLGSIGFQESAIKKTYNVN